MTNNLIYNIIFDMGKYIKSFFIILFLAVENRTQEVSSVTSDQIYKNIVALKIFPDVIEKLISEYANPAFENEYNDIFRSFEQNKSNLPLLNKLIIRIDKLIKTILDSELIINLTRIKYYINKTLTKINNENSPKTNYNNSSYDHHYSFDNYQFRIR